MAGTVTVAIESGAILVEDGVFHVGELAPLAFSGYTPASGNTIRLTLFDRDGKTPLADNHADAAVMDLRGEKLRKAFHVERCNKVFYATATEYAGNGDSTGEVLATGQVPVAWSPLVFDAATGEPASLQGPRGYKGDEGKSAYELAVERGYTGSKEEWLQSLKGDPGLPASIAKMRERTGSRLWHNVALSKNENDQWVMDVEQDGGGDGGLFDAEVKASGTTTARSLKDRFAETMNVKDFGAKGNGVADDTTAIQAAINKATENAAVKPSVYIPAGIYVCGSISIPHGINIFGDGINQTFIRAKSRTTDIFVIETAEPCCIHDMTFRHYGYNDAGDPQTGGSYISIPYDSISNRENKYSRFYNLVMYHSYNGINFESATWWSVESCVFRGYNKAISVKNTSHPDNGDSDIRSCMFYGITFNGTGVYQENSGGLRILSNKFHRGEYGYRLYASDSFTSILLIDGNSFEGQRHTSVLCESTAHPGSESVSFSLIDIIGNEFKIGTDSVTYTENDYARCIHLCGADPSAYTEEDTGLSQIEHVIVSDNFFVINNDYSTAIDVERARNVTVGENSIIARSYALNNVGVSIGSYSDCPDCRLHQQDFMNFPGRYPDSDKDKRYKIHASNKRKIEYVGFVGIDRVVERKRIFGIDDLTPRGSSHLTGDLVCCKATLEAESSVSGYWPYSSGAYRFSSDVVRGLLVDREFSGNGNEFYLDFCISARNESNTNNNVIGVGFAQRYFDEDTDLEWKWAVVTWRFYFEGFSQGGTTTSPCVKYILNGRQRGSDIPLDISTYVGRKMRVSLGSLGKNCVVKLIDLASGAVIFEHTSEPTIGGTIAYRYDKPVLFPGGGTSTDVYDIGLCTEVASGGTTKVAVFGDSIAEGYGIDRIEDTWGYKLSEMLPYGSVYLSGRTGDIAEGTLAKVKACGLRPEYGLFLVGHNDISSILKKYSLPDDREEWTEEQTAQWEEAIDDLKDTLKEIAREIAGKGGIPCCCYNPSARRSDLTPIYEEIIDDLKAATPPINVRKVRFDIATSVNYDLSQGVDRTNLFADSAHPNEAGAERMFRRVLIDLPELGRI